MRNVIPVVLACAGLLAGCGSADRPATPAASQTTPATRQTTPAKSPTPFQVRAEAVAKTWRDSDAKAAWTSGFIPLQGLVMAPDFSPQGDLKGAFLDGWIRSASALPDATSRGDIRFADGASLRVPLEGAQTAYRRFPKRSGPCPTAGQPRTCQWLTITAARLSTMPIVTSRGQAVVPAWHYTVAGLRQPLVRVAVAPSAITSLPVVAPPGRARPTGLVGAAGLISSTADGITFDIGIGACDTGARGLVKEFPDLVVVGGSVTEPSDGKSCVAMLNIDRVDVRTEQPIGNRPIIDALSGRPLLAEPTPKGP